MSNQSSPKAFCPPPTKSRKAQFRFTPADDELLVTQAISIAPWSCEHGQMAKAWDQLAIDFNMVRPGTYSIRDLLSDK